MSQVRVEGEIQRAAVHLLAQYWRGLLLSCWVFLILHEPAELTLVLLSPSKALQLPWRANQWQACGSTAVHLWVYSKLQL